MGRNRQSEAPQSTIDCASDNCGGEARWGPLAVSQRLYFVVSAASAASALPLPCGSTVSAASTAPFLRAVPPQVPQPARQDRVRLSRALSPGGVAHLQPRRTHPTRLGSARNEPSNQLPLPPTTPPHLTAPPAVNRGAQDAGCRALAPCPGALSGREPWTDAAADAATGKTP